MPKHNNQVGPQHTVVIKKSGGIQKPQHTVHHPVHHTLPGGYSRTFIPAAQHQRTVTHTQAFRPAAVRSVSHTQTFIPAATMPRPVMPAAPRPVVHTQAFAPAGSATNVTAAIQVAKAQAALHAVQTATRPRM